MSTEPVNTADFTVKICRFRPIGVISITAEIEMTYSSTPKIYMEGSRIYIKLKEGDSPAILNFYILGPEYIFVGIAFSEVYGDRKRVADFSVHLADGANSSESGDVKPKLLAVRDQQGGLVLGTGPVPYCQMQVKMHTGVDPSLYDYVLLVQEIKTALVGLIDPDIETDIGV